MFSLKNYSGSHSHEVQVICPSLLISMASQTEVYLTRPGTAICLFNYLRCITALNPVVSEHELPMLF